MRIVSNTGPIIGLAKIGMMPLIVKVGPLLYQLRQAGYWLSDEIIGIAKGLAEE